MLGSRAGRNPRLRVPPSSPVSAAAERLLGTTAQALQKAFLESDMLSLWDRWPAAPDLATWRLRLSQSLNWREPTLLAYLSPPWMQGISMKSIRRTSTNPRQARASSEEWWNNPIYLGDLWRQLRQSYNRAVADTQLMAHLLLPCGWQGLGAPASFQAWASEVEEPSSGHWFTRDLPAPHNISRQELSQRSLSQC